MNIVQALLEVLPNRLTADILEQLRLSKQTLVELGSRAGALRQMLLDLLEDPHEIRRICIMGRDCTLKRGDDDMECSVPLEKQVAEEEEEEIEMLLENYLQRCESCHGQAERLLDSAKEMEDSISVNLRFGLCFDLYVACCQYLRCHLVLFLFFFPTSLFYFKLCFVLFFIF